MKSVLQLVCLVVMVMASNTALAQAVVAPATSFQMVDANGKVLGRAYPKNAAGYDFNVEMNVGGQPAIVSATTAGLYSVVDFGYASADCTGQPFVVVPPPSQYSMPFIAFAVVKDGAQYRTFSADLSGSPSGVAITHRLVGESCQSFPVPGDRTFAATEAAPLKVQAPFRLQVEPTPVTLTASPVDAVHPIGLAGMALTIMLMAYGFRRQILNRLDR